MFSKPRRNSNELFVPHLLWWVMLLRSFSSRLLSTSAGYPFSSLCSSLYFIRNTSLHAKKYDCLQSLFSSLSVNGVSNVKIAADLMSGNVPPSFSFYLELFNSNGERINLKIADKLMKQCMGDFFHLSEKDVNQLVIDTGITLSSDTL